MVKAKGRGESESEAEFRWFSGSSDSDCILKGKCDFERDYQTHADCLYLSEDELRWFALLAESGFEFR
jgi:hypothetical protein